MLYIHYCNSCKHVHILSGHNRYCPICEHLLAEINISFLTYTSLDEKERKLLITKATRSVFLF